MLPKDTTLLIQRGRKPLKLNEIIRHKYPPPPPKSLKAIILCGRPDAPLIAPTVCPDLNLCSIMNEALKASDLFKKVFENVSHILLQTNIMTNFEHTMTAKYVYEN